MTPSARIQAAIEVLDAILAGAAAEQALSRWTRAHRFAGSKDRAALRDLVFEALRCRDSFAALGGALSGRGLQIGRCAASSVSVDDVFDGHGYGPPPVTEAERAKIAATADLPRAVALDMPDWLLARLDLTYGALADEIARAMQVRAPLDLRVNTARSDPEAARARLADEGIQCAPVLGVATALRVTEGARRVARSAPYLDGTVEVQDAASQSCVLKVPVPDEGRILDFCAGGGGKALALTARTRAQVHVHDISARRMQDIPARAARAGAHLPTWTGKGSDRFEMVFCDAPCSGSGTWRRTPEAKWALSEASLADYRAAQQQVLEQAAGLVQDGGVLVYATCSVLADENTDQADWFSARFPEFDLETQTQTLPDAPGDGFYHAIFRKRLSAKTTKG